MTARTSQILLILSAFVTGLVIFTGVFLYATGNFGSGGQSDSAIGGSFKMIYHNSKQIIVAHIKGRPFLVFFGYTRIVPTFAHDVVRRLRGPARARQDADRTGALFITVDRNEIRPR
jgi:protein SCO1/2